MIEHLRINLAANVRRRDGQYDFGLGQRFCYVIGRRDGVGQGESRQIDFILALQPHRLCDLRAVRPQPDAMPPARRDERQRRPPTARPDDSNLFHPPIRFSTASGSERGARSLRSRYCYFTAPNLFSAPAISRLMFSECLKMITAETAHRAVIICAKSPTGSIHVCVRNTQRGRNAAAMIEPSET